MTKIIFQTFFSNFLVKKNSLTHSYCNSGPGSSLWQQLEYKEGNTSLHFMQTEIYAFKTIHTLLYMHHCGRRKKKLLFMAFWSIHVTIWICHYNVQMAPVEKRWCLNSSPCFRSKKTRLMQFIHPSIYPSINIASSSLWKFPPIFLFFFSP